MNEIASYDAVWFDGRYQFSLLADALQVRGTLFLQRDTEATVPLAGLQARVERLRFRSRSFWSGLGLAIAGNLGCIILVSGFKIDPLAITPVMIGGLGVAGAALALAAARKTEFAQFVTDAGVPVVAIARSRRGNQDFDGFIEKVLGQIRTCKGLA
jgi:hypothetical protein